MRLLAGYRLLVGVLLCVVAAELVRLFNADIAGVVHTWILRVHADPHHPLIAAIARKAAGLDLRTLEEFAAVTTALGALHVVEGVGLWLSRTWAESLCVVSTSVFLPIEVHEVVTQFHVLTLLTFVANVAVVAYLVRRRRARGLSDAA